MARAPKRQANPARPVRSQRRRAGSSGSSSSPAPASGGVRASSSAGGPSGSPSPAGDANPSPAGGLAGNLSLAGGLSGNLSPAGGLAGNPSPASGAAGSASPSRGAAGDRAASGGAARSPSTAGGALRSPLPASGAAGNSSHSRNNDDNGGAAAQAGLTAPAGGGAQSFGGSPSGGAVSPLPSAPPVPHTACNAAEGCGSSDRPCPAAVGSVPVPESPVSGPSTPSTESVIGIAVQQQAVSGEGSGSASRAPSPQAAATSEGTPALRAAGPGGGAPVLQQAGGAARPITIRPMMSDTPSSSAPRAASAARPPSSPGASSTARAATPAARQGSTHLSDAISTGMRPMRLQLVAVSTNIDNVLESVRDVLVKVELLSRGHERLASVMHAVQASMTVGFKEVMTAMQQMSSTADGQVNVALTQTLAVVNTVKTAFRDDEKQRIITATRSADVYYSTTRTWQQLTCVVMEARDLDRAAAKQWLLSTIQLPGRRNANVLVGMRACVPILRAKPHLMQALKDLVCTAFLVGVGLNRSDLTNDLARLWLDNGAYMTSEMGLPSLLAGLADMIRYLGGGEQMITEALTVGGRPVIRCLLGHFALASCFVRSMLEAKAGMRPRRRSGLGGAIYEQWESELARADKALPNDCEMHHCLVITDGNDPNRGILDEEGDGDSDVDVAEAVDEEVPANDVNLA